MKKQIILIAAAILTIMSSCGSHCQSDKWRKRRFVEIEKPVKIPANPKVAASV